MNYHTLNYPNETKEEDDNKNKQSSFSRGRLCCGIHLLDGVAATAGTKIIT